MSTPPSALEIARALIRFPSVTPADCGALPYLRDLLAEAGFAAELVTFEAAGTPRRAAARTNYAGVSFFPADFATISSSTLLGAFS